MALLKIKLKEPRELSGYGLFTPGVAREVPDMVAKNLVTGNPDMWEIEASKEARQEKEKQFAATKKFDTKAAQETKGDE